MYLTVISRTETQADATLSIRAEWQRVSGWGGGDYFQDDFDLPAIGPLSDAKPGDQIELTIIGAEEVE